MIEPDIEYLLTRARQEVAMAAGAAHPAAAAVHSDLSLHYAARVLAELGQLKPEDVGRAAINDRAERARHAAFGRSAVRPAFVASDRE